MDINNFSRILCYCYCTSILFSSAAAFRNSHQLTSFHPDTGTMIIKIVIADDDMYARNHLESLLRQFQHVQIIASVGEQGIERVFENSNVDLIFCTPESLPYDFVAGHHKKPQRVIIANDGFDACRAFEVRAFDYLQKPLTLARLKKTIDFFEMEASSPFPISELSKLKGRNSRFYIKEGNKFYWIRLEDVFYFESAGNYVKMFHKDICQVFYSSLHYLSGKLSPHHFFRANRSFLVNLDHMQGITQNKTGRIILTLTNNFSVALSEKQTSAFRDQLSL